MKAEIIFRRTPLNWENKHIGLGSHLIRKITKSQYDHVELLLEIDGIQYVESGTASGVRRMLFSEWQKLYKGQSHFIKEVPCYRTEAEMKLLFQVFKGVQYDYGSLGWHIVYRATERVSGTPKWYGKGYKNGFGAFYCSEWVAFCLGHMEWFKCDVKYFEDLK